MTSKYKKRITTNDNRGKLKTQIKKLNNQSKSTKNIKPIGIIKKSNRFCNTQSNNTDKNIKAKPAIQSSRTDTNYKPNHSKSSSNNHLKNSKNRNIAAKTIIIDNEKKS
ncbi:hypothetical protein FDC66_17465, partial [Clostridium botulinum]|nr:hypothetical protein [Clostridium botulinum]